MKDNELLGDKLLFNPEADDFSNRKIINGESTNLLNLANVKYKEFLDLVDYDIYPNNWHPVRIDMSNDKYQYNNELLPEEKEAFDNIISFLIFLDSVQTNNLPNIAEYITLPEITYFLARQTWDEALHSRSYGHILQNMMSPEKANEITYKWRDNKILLERNKIITKYYQDSKDTKNPRNFLLVLIANFLLEGLYFYNGFQFFHTMASRGLIIASQTQIRYIQRDEQYHCLAFSTLINAFRKEEPEFFKEYEYMIYDMFKIAVEWEIKFSNDVLGNKILGITKQSIEDYAFFLANQRLTEIGLEPIFEERKNPYLHLEKIAAIEDETSNRSNQFEVTSITYKSPEILDGWDNI
jgi:ribonucleoside-diphosphate reductase beta chain